MKVNGRTICEMVEASRGTQITTLILASSKMGRLTGKEFTLGTTEKCMMANGTKA
jgi:hypothetical protein